MDNIFDVIIMCELSMTSINEYKECPKFVYYLRWDVKGPYLHLVYSGWGG